MALIKCPKCGGTVSDSAVKCVHCGENLSAIRRQEQIEKEYSVLPIEEKQRLREEYDKFHPELDRYETYWSKLAVAGLALLAAGVIFLIAALIVRFVCDSLTGALILTAVCAACVGVGCFLILLFKRPNEGYIREQKKFHAWLKKEKGLTCNVVLSPKERKIYDSYKVD